MRCVVSSNLWPYMIAPGQWLASMAVTATPSISTALPSRGSATTSLSFTPMSRTTRRLVTSEQ